MGDAEVEVTFYLEANKLVLYRHLLKSRADVLSEQSPFDLREDKQSFAGS